MIALAVLLMATAIDAAPRVAAPSESAPPAPAATGEAPPLPTGTALPPLQVPVKGVRVGQFRDSFADRRGGGTRPHEAIDLMAPRGTPVRAVAPGRIEKLFLSVPGGNTIYQFDATGHFAYYYAHLDRYADGLAAKQEVQTGDVIGYVGSTGNASPDAPHLHFAVFVLGPERQWWKGTAVDPFGAFVDAP